MQKLFSLISERIGRTILVGLSGLLFFIVSVITMIPLRMAENPVENYNLFYTPLLAFLFLGLFYRACVEAKDSRGILYGYFAGMVSWALLGEVASMPVDKGIITQFSGVNIKLLGGYFYVVAGWMMLKILWLTKASKPGVNTFFFVFLSIWSFELYMDNYSSGVPLDLMPTIGNYVTVVSSILCLIVLVFSWRTPSLERKTFLGCVFYITFSLVLMGGQWKTPQKFYIKYESKHIGHEIEELQEEQEYLKFLTNYMLEKGLITKEELGISDNETAGE